MGTVEASAVPILKKGCFYECCSNGGNVMKTTKHMTIRQKLNTEKGCRYRMYYAIYRWISGVYDYSHVYIAVLFLLRLQHFTAPYIYRVGEL